MVSIGLKRARGEHDDMQKGNNNHWTKIGREALQLNILTMKSWQGIGAETKMRRR